MRRALFLSAAVVALIAAGSSAAAKHDLGDRKMALGQTYTITGHTAGRATGAVVLTGRWSGGRWHVLVRTATQRNGSYRLTLKPERRGRLELRLATPDHRVARVTLTVI